MDFEKYLKLLGESLQNLKKLVISTKDAFVEQSMVDQFDFKFDCEVLTNGLKFAIVEIRLNTISQDSDPSILKERCDDLIQQVNEFLKNYESWRKT
jgi:hypothetical protein